ncbi:MAG: carbohydrate kinase [Opitutus sp.]|nr:carbohydrate kinase [Opitutus sp.]
MRHPSILSCGEMLWDLFPDGPRFGGAPANFACHAALHGGRVAMLSAVGNDLRGREASEILRRFGLDISLIQTIANAPTGAVGVSVDAAGKPSFEIHAGSAWDQIAWAAALDARLADIDAIYFGTLGQRGPVSRATIRRALAVAKSRGIVRMLDVNLRRPFFDAALIRESVAEASVLKFSDDELDEVFAACDIARGGNLIDSLRDLLVRHDLDLVALTRGAAGALLVSANEVVDQPGIPTIVRDTVGAGDSFTAALVVGLLRGAPLESIARVACETAAAVCAYSGAVPELPRSEPAI